MSKKPKRPRDPNQLARFVLDAATGDIEAVALYAKHMGQVKAVLTDMMMPIMDGPTTVRALQKLDPQARIIAMSGFMTNGKTSQIDDLRVQGHLAKPYTAEKLLTTLRDILALKQNDMTPVHS